MSPWIGPGPHDGDLDHEVVELAGFQPRQHGHLGARLDLEYADGVGVLDHVEYRRSSSAIVDFLHRERGTAIAVDEIERAADRRQHAEREHVHLEQPQRIEVVLVPLDHAALRHRRVLDRHQLRQRSARDHEAADVLRQVARKSDQRLDEMMSSWRIDRLSGIEAGFPQALAHRTAGCPTTPATWPGGRPAPSSSPSALPTSRTALFGW